MSRIVNFPTQDVMLEQAATWLVRLEQGPLTEREKSELKSWLAQSSQHVEAFRDSAAVWGKMDVLAGMADVYPLQAMAVSSPAGNRLSYATWGRSIAAVIIICVIGIGALQLSGDRRTGATIHTTEIGGRKQITLEDGSSVMLNTNTTLEIAFDFSVRAVNLVRGEAFFEVVKNAKRPFIVNAAGGQIKAVGTAFSVYKNNGSVEVTVTEGVVEVGASAKRLPKGRSAGDRYASEVIRIEQGQAASYGESAAPVHSLEPQDIAKKLFWQQGMLAFEGESLEQVITEFSRYSPLNITIADDEIRKLRVGGYFKSDDIAGMLNSLQYNFGIRVVRLDKDHIKLEKAR